MNEENCLECGKQLDKTSYEWSGCFCSQECMDKSDYEWEVIHEDFC